MCVLFYKKEKFFPKLSISDCHKANTIDTLRFGVGVMKKGITFCLAVLFIIGLFQTGVFASSIETKKIDGKVYLPIRAYFETDGYKVTWEDKTKTITAKKGETIVVLTVGSKIMKINGTEYDIKTPVVLLNGLSYFPSNNIVVAKDTFGIETEVFHNQNSFRIEGFH